MHSSIWVPHSMTCRGVIAFIAACVPTGMNMGVSIVPWGVTNVPRRAAVFASVFIRVKYMFFQSTVKVAVVSYVFFSIVV